MKQYRQFLKEMPSKTVVFAFGRFSPPTTGHGLLVNVVKKIAATNKADYVIYASRTQDKKKNPLSVEKKVHYLNLMFPNTNFRAANDRERTFIEAAKALNAKYKNVIMIAGSDRVPEYERLLTQYNCKEFNFDSIQVISAGERDPDSDDVSGMSASKMRALATSNDFVNFKKGLPHTMRDIDGKRLMNDVRQGMGLDVIKEQVKFNVDDLREKYYNKEIFNIGDIVESNNQPFEIVDRGSNYLVVVNENGETSRKWIQDVVMSENNQMFTTAQFDDEQSTSEEISFKGYTTKNLCNAPGAAKAFQQTIKNVGNIDPVAILNALKATDMYLGMTVDDIMKGGSEKEQDLLNWSDNHLKAKQYLEKHGEFASHAEYWHLYKDQLDKAVFAVRIEKGDSSNKSVYESVMLDKNKDKLKVAKMIASILGANPDQCNCPETLVNNALRKAKSLPKDSLKIVSKMLKLADDVGIEYDTKIIKATNQLTTEQVEMAMERAERYGRRYPNAIDTAWALQEGKAPSIVMDKSKPGNAASLRPDDNAKLTAMNKKGINVPLEGLPKEYKQDIMNYANTGHVSGGTDQPGENQPEVTHVGASLTTNGDDTMARMKAKKVMGEELDIDDLTDEEINEMVESISEEEIFEAYDDDEFAIVDENGVEVDVIAPVSEQAIMEVLSKMERIKAKLRMAKNQSKIEAKREIALKQHSDSHKINKRARHLAINLIKKKLLKGRDPAHLSTTEKERIDRIIEKKKKVIGRLAMKLTSRVRQTEKERLTHKKD